MPATPSSNPSRGQCRDGAMIWDAGLHNATRCFLALLPPALKYSTSSLGRRDRPSCHDTQRIVKKVCKGGAEREMPARRGTSLGRSGDTARTRSPGRSPGSVSTAAGRVKVQVLRERGGGKMQSSSQENAGAAVQREAPSAFYCIAVCCAYAATSVAITFANKIVSAWIKKMCLVYASMLSRACGACMLHHN